MTPRASLGTLVLLATACGSAPPQRPAAAPATPGTQAPVRNGPSPGQAAYDEAYALASSGNLDGALPLFRKATELDPGLAIAWFDLGGVSEQLGDVPAAMAALEHCVAANPAFAEARVELGTLDHQVGKHEPAIAQFRAALTTVKPFIDPRFQMPYTRGHALHNLAATYVDLKFSAAAAAIAASILNDPDAHDDGLDRLIDHTETMVAAGTPAPALVAKLTAFEHELAGATPAAAGAVADRYLAFLQATDVDAAAPIDRWRAVRTMARAEALALRSGPARTHLLRANELARTLPLIAWLDGKYGMIELEIAGRQLDGALADLEELVWIELIVQYARAEAGGRRYSQRARTDHVLDPLRTDPRFAKILETYRVP